MSGRIVAKTLPPPLQLLAPGPPTSELRFHRSRGVRPQASGFTLLELLVVVAIIAMATIGVSLAMRDNADSTLEREAQRLAALLESARAQSRSSGIPVVWQAGKAGFEFRGMAPGALPSQWIGSDTVVRGTATLLLGPEPLIDPQSVELSSVSRPDRSLRVGTDGLRPFSVQADITP